MKLSDVKQKLSQYQIYTKKHLGQNFLIDENILNKITDIINDSTYSVIEIGPGLGSLTKKLLNKYAQVLCYEIDPDMIKVLKASFNDQRLIILEQDFLKSNLESDTSTYLGTKKVILIANLPYYITTAILTKILEEAPFIKQMVVMMQKEVANRICGVPSTKDYNSLSVLMQFLTNAKVLFSIPPQSFYPMPKVESSVVFIERKNAFLVEPINMEYFIKFNCIIFSQRRKTLLNNIYANLNYDKSLIEEILLKNNFPTNIRAETLSVDEIVKLSNEFYLRLNN